jgi:hypothetical protein
MSDHEVELALPHINDITSQVDVDAAAQSTTAQAAKAARVAAAVGRPVAFGVDSALDKAQSATQAKVDQVLNPQASTCP